MVSSSRDKGITLSNVRSGLSGQKCCLLVSRRGTLGSVLGPGERSLRFSIRNILLLLKRWIWTSCITTACPENTGVAHIWRHNTSTAQYGDFSNSLLKCTIDFLTSNNKGFLKFWLFSFLSRGSGGGPQTKCKRLQGNFHRNWGACKRWAGHMVW